MSSWRERHWKAKIFPSSVRTWAVSAAASWSFIPRTAPRGSKNCNRMDIDLTSIMQTFMTECEEHFAAMEEALVALEANPQDDKLLEVIFRGAHTIKGNAASLGFPKIAGFAHVFEDLLQRFRNHSLEVTPRRITLLLRGIDALRQIVPDAIAGADELKPSHVELLNQLADGNPTEASTHRTEDASNPERRSFGGRREDALDWLERGGTIRVDTQKLDRMLNLAGEIAVALGRLRQAIEQPGVRNDETFEAHNQVERLCLDLQENIMKVRMVPVGPTFRLYLRTVRDV